MTNQSAPLPCWNSAYRCTVYIDELYRCTSLNEYNFSVIPNIIYLNMVNVLIMFGWKNSSFFLDGFIKYDRTFSILSKYNFRIVITNFWPMNYDGIKHCWPIKHSSLRLSCFYVPAVLKSIIIHNYIYIYIYYICTSNFRIM